MPEAWGATRGRVERTLGQIEASQSTINAFITVDADGARLAADAADARHAAHTSLGPIDGAIVAVKDGLDTAGLRTTYGAKIFADRVPVVDATAVARLRLAGAIIIGKTNMAELACGTVGFNDHFGPVRNPLDTERYAGGSSSGSAAAVAAGLVDYALGTDTSCSVRQPSSSCGIVGLKPTWGRIPNDGCCIGVVAADHVGPMTRTVRQSAELLAALQDTGWDDPTTQLDTSLAGVQVGVLDGPFVDACAVDVRAAHERSLHCLETLGANLLPASLDIDLVHADDALNALCRDLVDAYGDAILAAPAGDVGAELLDWVRLFTSNDVPDIETAVRLRGRAKQLMAALFDDVDVVVCPTTRVGAGLLSEAAMEPRHDRVGNCSVFSLTGVPSLTVPAGAAATGMPTGLLISGAAGADATVLGVGNAFTNADL